MTLLLFFWSLVVIPCHSAPLRCCEVICARVTATVGGGVMPAEKQQ